MDADIPQWIDEVQVTAVAGGSIVNPSSTSAGATNTPGINTSTGFPVDNNNADNDSSDGNATFTFNQTNITQVTIVYSNTTTGTPGNQWISIHDISFDIAPVITKQFSPSSITSGGVSRVTLNLNNTDTNTVTLTADLVDNLPAGVSVANPANIGGTCPGVTNAVVGSGSITYTSGSMIPPGGCTIGVDVTSATVGSYTNSIAAGALQTNRGINPSAASDNLTVTSGGGGTPACPAGTTLVNLGTARNANVSATGTSAGILREAEAYGPIEALGTNLQNTQTAARLRGSEPTLVLDLTDTIPENAIIIFSIARNNNNGNFDINSSTDNVSFGSEITFNAGPNDRSQQISYTVPSGGARYVRFDRNGGSLWVDGVQYSQICQAPPSADLTITKDDSSLTYTPGTTGTYTVMVVNNGPDDVSGATINDNLPNGVIMTAAWSCTPSSASSSCNTAPNATDPISIEVDIVNSDSIVITIPVQFSANMGDY